MIQKIKTFGGDAKKKKKSPELNQGFSRNAQRSIFVSIHAPICRGDIKQILDTSHIGSMSRRKEKKMYTLKQLIRKLELDPHVIEDNGESSGADWRTFFAHGELDLPAKVIHESEELDIWEGGEGILLVNDPAFSYLIVDWKFLSDDEEEWIKIKLIMIHEYDELKTLFESENLLVKKGEESNVIILFIKNKDETRIIHNPDIMPNPFPSMQWSDAIQFQSGIWAFANRACEFSLGDFGKIIPDFKDGKFPENPTADELNCRWEIFPDGSAWLHSNGVDEIFLDWVDADSELLNIQMREVF